MIEIAKPNKDINLRQLTQEVAALNLPGFTGMGIHEERRGEVTADSVNPPYIVVRCDALNSRKKTALNRVTAAHVAQTEAPDRRTVLRGKARDGSISQAETMELLGLIA